jgi:hypothetical protein
MLAGRVGRALLLGSLLPCYETHMADASRTQLERFTQAARELEIDEDEARFYERAKTLVKHKPVEKPE